MARGRSNESGSTADVHDGLVVEEGAHFISISQRPKHIDEADSIDKFLQGSSYGLASFCTEAGDLKNQRMTALFLRAASAAANICRGKMEASLALQKSVQVTFCLTGFVDARNLPFKHLQISRTLSCCQIVDSFAAQNCMCAILPCLSFLPLY